MKTLSDYRKDPQFQDLQREILELNDRLNDLLIRLKHSFPLGENRTWAITAGRSLGVFGTVDSAVDE